MKWRVFFDPAAEKQFSKFGKSAQWDIEKYIAKNLESVEDSRRFGTPYLSIKGAWWYRMGDYWFVCLIQNEKLIVLVGKWAIAGMLTNEK